MWKFHLCKILLKDRSCSGSNDGSLWNESVTGSYESRPLRPQLTNLQSWQIGISAFLLLGWTHLTFLCNVPLKRNTFSECSQCQADSSTKQESTGHSGDHSLLVTLQQILHSFLYKTLLSFLHIPPTFLKIEPHLSEPSEDSLLPHMQKTNWCILHKNKWNRKMENSQQQKSRANLHGSTCTACG